MGSSRFWLKAAYEESKSIPHEFPRSHWLKATCQCVLERYLSATMPYAKCQMESSSYGHNLMANKRDARGADFHPSVKFHPGANCAYVCYSFVHVVRSRD